jgi:hypothetical protein
MKNLICSFVILAFLSACGNEKTNNKTPQDISELQKIAADTPNFTQIQWIDSVYNFGTIEEGAQIQVRFKFKNIGNKPLYLTEVKAGCGCTTPDYTKEAIEPSKEGWINGVFDSKNQMGEVHKYIMVKTNTINGTEHKLMFTGTVNKK